MKVTVDPYAGFCFGVERAIRIAEESMYGELRLHSLGELVHNEEENRRLEKLGLKVISVKELGQLSHGRVLFRAHGEPPSSYNLACENDNKVIDATCPIVKKLQVRVMKSYQEIRKKNGMVLIFGRKDHPEVIGLLGQVPGNILAASDPAEVKGLHLPSVVRLFAQTTRGTEAYLFFQDAVRRRLNELHPPEAIDFKSHNTICPQVSGREKKIKDFAAGHEVVLFVSGKESSNGKLLFGLAKEENPRAYFVSHEDELKPEWFAGISDVGISGATSTPDWLLNRIAKKVEKL